MLISQDVQIIETFKLDLSSTEVIDDDSFVPSDSDSMATTSIQASTYIFPSFIHEADVVGQL